MDDPLAVSERDKAVPTLYFNGFAIGIGNADFTLQIRLENTDSVILKCSYTVAKTLSIKLSEVVARFEAVTNHDVMTTEEVGTALKTAEEKRAAEKQNAGKPTK